MMPGLEAAELPADAVEVGRILDAWGIKGWFKVLPYSASPEALFSSRRWFLLPPEKGARTFSGPVALAVKETREHSDAVVASAHDVPDRNAAEALKGRGAKRALPLAVSAPFHCALMQPAADEMAQALAGATIVSPRAPLVRERPGAVHGRVPNQQGAPNGVGRRSRAVGGADARRLGCAGDGVRR